MERPPARKDRPSRYQTYLLTCWQERDEVAGTATWRFRWETPRSGERRLFLTFKDVMRAIETEINQDQE